ncbi:hypothetical protein VN97_g10934, partial [Penicillium thymicola]
IEAEVANAATRQHGTPTSMALCFPFILIFVGTQAALGARARIGVLGSCASARDTPATPGGGFDAALAERVRRVVENETGASARAHNEDDGNEARVWGPGDRRHLVAWGSVEELEIIMFTYSMC